MNQGEHFFDTGGDTGLRTPYRRGGQHALATGTDLSTPWQPRFLLMNPIWEATPEWGSEPPTFLHVCRLSASHPAHPATLPAAALPLSPKYKVPTYIHPRLGVTGAAAALFFWLAGCRTSSPADGICATLPASPADAVCPCKPMLMLGQYCVQ